MEKDHDCGLADAVLFTMLILPRLIWRFHPIPTRILAGLFIEIKKLAEA